MAIYRLYRAESEAALADAEPIYEGAGTSFDDYDLPLAGTDYYYQARGFLSNGTTKVYESAVASAKTYAKLPSGMNKMSGWDDSMNAAVTDNTGFSYKLTADSNHMAVLKKTNRATGQETILLDMSDTAMQAKYPDLTDCKFEATSVLTHPVTGKIIIWSHYEKAAGYSTGAMVCFTCDPETDEVTYSGLILPNGKQARDKTIYTEGSDAYLIAAGNEPGESSNRTMYIHKLNADWNNVDTDTGVVATLFEGEYREAPAMIRDEDGVYYLFTSKAAGWLPSEGMYATAASLAGPWSALKPAANSSSFSSQQNGVITLSGTAGTSYILHGSRWWRSANSGGNTYMPMQSNAGFATAEFFAEVYWNEDGLMIPERAGKVVSAGKAAAITAGGSTVEAPETVDNDYTTKTTANKAWPAEWVVDLGEKTNLSGLEISWYMVKGSEAYYPYKVYGSNDKSNWNVLLDASTESNANTIKQVDYGFTYTVLAGKYRYVKVEILKSQPQNNPTSSWYTPQLWEVKVLGGQADDSSAVEEARAALTAKIEEIRAALAADKANGITYATEKLESWQYTGNKSGTADTLPEMNEALAAAEKLAADESAKTDDLNSCVTALDAQYKALRTLSETYTSIPGTDGTVIKADTGLPMQAHGGSAMTLKEGTGDGCVNYDLDGDGSITEGKTVYLWFGEDKTNNTRPVDGVRCYSSTDLYNWTDHGTILYTQSTILPIEEGTEKAITSSVGANGTGTTKEYNVMQRSKTNLETLKAWGKLSTAPEGVTESEFRNVKNFLRAYVTEYEKAPTDLNDISWTAKTYDEEPITATSLLYPDSTDTNVRNVTTTRLQLAFETLYGNYCVTERPKMIYNESTKQFVLFWHADGPLYNNKDLSDWVAGGCVGNCPASRYSRAMVGIATSDSPFGPFTVQNVTRMNYDATLNANRLGEARDMTVFVDTGVDKNNDGADDAYVIYSSEMNAKLYVSLLNKDYTGLAAEADQADDAQFAARIVTDNSREAPAMFKYGGYYYLITSGTDGWNSTAHIYYRSKNVLSGWEKIGNPAKNDTGKMFNTQVTYVLPVDAENGKFIYMADRWNGSNLTDSRTIWLPIQMNTDSTLSVLGEKNWTLDRLDQLLPTTVNTELPKVVWSDGSNLPKTVDVTTQGKDVTSKVEWDTDSLKNFGTVSITGTLTECNNISISTTATVVPKDLLYFANPTKTPVSSDYTAIVNASAETLKNSAVNDGAYNAENGFGYTGTAGTLRNSNANIYESMR